MTYRRKLRKCDKSDAVYSRRSRFTKFQNRWYFVTREQEMRGPYTTPKIAKIAAKIFVRSITLQQRYIAKVIDFADYRRPSNRPTSAAIKNNQPSCKVIDFSRYSTSCKPDTQ